MPGKPPDESRVAEAIRLYESGKTTRAVAAEIGVDSTTVSRWVRHIARRTGPPRRPDVSDERLWRMRYEEKLTYDQIAAAVGMTRTPVRKRLARMAREKYEASPDALQP